MSERLDQVALRAVASDLIRELTTLVEHLDDKEDSSGRNRAINSDLVRLLELVLSTEEVQALKLLGENKDLLEFFTKNHDMLKKTKKIRGILRVPESL